MSCPQGLTLSGKMCTINPVLSCPPGYTLVNNMCQQDDGLEGIGGSMNMPPSDNMTTLSPNELLSAEAVVKTPSPAPSMMMPPPSQMNNVLGDVGNMLKDTLTQGLAGDQPISMEQARLMIQPSLSSPMPMRQPQLQPLASPMPMRPLSPPPMRSPTPTPTRVAPMRPSSPSGQCPMGYMMNSSDKMCYPL